MTLLKAVENATSYNQILRNLGKSSSGDAVKLLKTQLEQYNISVNFNNTNKVSNFIKKPIEEYLQKDRYCDSKSLKKRLIDENILENKCSICGIGPKWNNKPLTLQLDHINGDHNDNTLENLRIICPNCHSQTNTFSGKGTSKDKPSKEELLDVIINSSFTEATRRFNASDSTIRKWCRNYEIPSNKKEIKEYLSSVK